MLSLRSDPGLIEKDWHVTRAIGVLASHDHGTAVPAFGGGTSLSKGWGLIKRFSEDIDFKVACPLSTHSGRSSPGPALCWPHRGVRRGSQRRALSGMGFPAAKAQRTGQR